MAWRAFSIGSVTYEGKFARHFEAVFLPAVQAFHHKLPLIDFMSLYWWYGIFLALWFRWIGLSVHIFSWTMSGLQWMSFIAVLLASAVWIKNRWLQFCLFAVLLNAVGNWGPIGLPWDPYFQYFPIRFVCPAIGLLLFAYWARSIHLWLSFLMSVFCGLAIFWNLDSGITLTGAWLTFLIFDWTAGYFLDKSTFYRCAFNGSYLQRNWIHLFAGILTPLLTCLLFLKVLFGSTQEIDWSSFTRYHSQFFGAGYYMLSMPVLPHAWQLVCLTYVIALCAGIVGALNHQKTPALDFLFFTGVMGIGLFTYYQGRSYDYNLTAVAWPAMIILAIFPDHALTLFRTSQEWGIGFQKRILLSLILPMHLMGGLAWISQIRGIPVI